MQINNAIGKKRCKILYISIKKCNFVTTMIQMLLTTAPLMACLFTTVNLFLEQKRLNRPNTPMRWLTVWAIAATLLYMGHLIYFQRLTEWIPISDTIYVAMNLCVYPLYLIYISELTEEIPYSKRPVILTLLLGPSILGGIICGMLYFSMNTQEDADFIIQYLYHNQYAHLEGAARISAIAHHICRLIFCFQVVTVAIIGTKKIRKYHESINQLYADTENKDVRGISIILYLLVATSLCSIIFNVIGRYYFINNLWLSIPSLSFTILLFLIGWFGMHQHFTISDVIMHHPKETEETANKTYSHTEKDNLCKQLEQLMQEKKLFLEHDLRLEQVTREMGTNRTYLLQALKDDKGTTFKEYINRLRIIYAEKLMQDNPTLTKSDIAMMSGYNTLSSFYRNYNAYKSTR